MNLGKYDRAAQHPEAFHVVDEHNMMTHSKTVSGYGEADSLGANMVAYVTYNDPVFPAASAILWYRNSQGEYVGQRHPNLPPEDHPMSRDHYKTTLITLRLYNSRTYSTRYSDKINEIIENTGTRISSMARRTPVLTLWSKAIQGNRRAELWYYLLSILTVLFIYLPVHALGSLIANYGKEMTQDEWVWGSKQLQDQPAYKQKIDKWIYPSYSLVLAGWSLYVLHNFPLLRRILKKLYLQMVGETNYVQQMLFGKTDLPGLDILRYKPMTTNRWSGYLSSRNDRYMKILPTMPEYNNMDSDLVRKLWNETQGV